MGAENEPQSVADASAELAAVGFDPEKLGQPAVEPEPIVEPTTIAERQAAASGVTPPAQATTPPVAAGSEAPPAGSNTPAPGTPDPFAEYGGIEAVKEAMAIRAGLSTEQGVRLIVAQGLTALGKDPEAVKAFMEGRITEQQALQSAPVAPPANPWDALTEEDLIDGVQFKQYAAEVRAQALADAQALVQRQQQPVLDAVQQERQVRAGQVTDSTLVELLGEGNDPASVDKDLAARVLAEANKYVDPNNWDSGHIRAAIIQGHHDVVKIAEAAQRAYLGRKSLVAASVPQTTGGAQAAGSEEPAEPKNLKEASEMAAKLGLLG